MENITRTLTDRKSVISEVAFNRLLYVRTAIMEVVKWYPRTINKLISFLGKESDLGQKFKSELDSDLLRVGFGCNRRYLKMF